MTLPHANEKNMVKEAPQQETHAQGGNEREKMRTKKKKKSILHS